MIIDRHYFISISIEYCALYTQYLYVSVPSRLPGDGVKLASIALDDQHSLLVWDWKRGQKLASTRVSGDKIFGVKWNRIDNNQLVTIGVRHIRFWTQTGTFPPAHFHPNACR